MGISSFLFYLPYADMFILGSEMDKMHKKIRFGKENRTVIFLYVHKISTWIKSPKGLILTYAPTYPHYPHTFLLFLCGMRKEKNKQLFCS